MIGQALGWLLSRTENSFQTKKWAFIFITIWAASIGFFMLNYGIPYSGEKPAVLLEDTNAYSPNDVHKNGNTIFVQSEVPAKVTPVRHIYYLKNHKTGSTTIYSILAEYCRSRGLLPLLPTEYHINNKPPLQPWQIMRDPQVRKYDMVFNHLVYTPKIFQYLHNDTFRFTTLREPLNHFVSVFHYFREIDPLAYLANIPGPDAMAEFLAHPQTYDAKGYDSYTNNRQSLDMGFSLSHSFNDTQYIKAFISECEKNFDLVLIADYFDESVILLKRALRWETGDILYFKKLSRTKGETGSALTDTQKEQHKRIFTSDIALYNHFLKIFKSIISQQLDLSGEVEEFKEILKKVRDFCEAQKPRTKQLIILAGRWSDQINILHSKCKWLKLGEIEFTKHLQQVQKKMLED